MEFENIKNGGLSISRIVEILIDDSIPQVSNLANLSRALFDGFEGVSFAGFYLADEEGTTLYLGPYQGPLACTTIPFSKGVCGHCATTGKTVLVEDVHSFPGHIACSSLSKSEIVVPIFRGDEVVGVLDIDSDQLATFDETDRIYLEQMIETLSKQLYS